ncbi:hypothetical protein [Nannocystis pusilla]|uniref:hypothetical protein n=1 Tax=Nannocystis pusilla TaxID=889268 RepID=UPI003BF1B1B4
MFSSHSGALAALLTPLGGVVHSAEMHKQRIAIVSTAGAGMLGTFLPWVHLPLLGSIAGSVGDGWITFAFYLPALLLGLLGNRAEPRSGGGLWTAMVFALLASALGLWKIVDLKLSLASGGNAMAQAMARATSVGIGLYLVTAAGVVLVVLALRLRR